MRIDPEQLGAALGFLKTKIETFATDGIRLAFSSADGEIFGVLGSRTFAGEIAAALTNQCFKSDNTFVMVIEVGEDWTCAGNPRGWEWLQQ